MRRTKERGGVQRNKCSVFCVLMLRGRISQYLRAKPTESINYEGVKEAS